MNVTIPEKMKQSILDKSDILFKKIIHLSEGSTGSATRSMQKLQVIREKN